MTLPRVSSILRILDDAYGDVPSGVLAAAAERGERLHRLCLSYLASIDGLCEEPSDFLVEDHKAYSSFREWVQSCQVKPIAIEEQSLCTAHQYTGTPDALVLFGPKQIPKLLDLKFTSTILRINRVQIQAYRKLDLYSEAKEVCLLHIKPLDGKLKHEPVTHDAIDWAAFLNALSVWRWRNA